MISDQLTQEVKAWIDNDPDLNSANLLRKWLNENNEADLKRCFNGFLQFGTAGLRGPLGPGPSCMNRAVVSRTATGILAFMKKHNLTSVIIGKDARHGSDTFAQDSAEIFAGAGINTFVFTKAIPTPVLAYAVNKLQINVGIMVTASHNPATDNGYKVYLGGSMNGIKFNGSQIIPPVDFEIATLINESELKPVRSNLYQNVNDSVILDYVNSVAKLVKKPNNLKIVYTPLHGVGAETFLLAFAKANLPPPYVVSEQEKPDPNFPTTPFPNPEESGTIDLAISYAKKIDADLVIANDPDADRCAVAISEGNNNWRILKGDEVGVILGDYLMRQSTDKNIAVASSLVSSSQIEKIAKSYQVPFFETLTGFKWISKVDKLLFGYEEALGYCVDSKNVNDKDGISAALLIVQIAGELKEKNSSLSKYLEEIGSKFGFYATEQISIRFDELGEIDQRIQKVLKNPPKVLGENALLNIENLSLSKTLSTIGIRLYYENQIRIIIRPSGTELKLKCYIEVVGHSKNDADMKISQLKLAMSKLLA